MCTAASYKTKDFYFGRTLDYEFSYGEQIVITPRNYNFKLREMEDLKSHYALVGMAHVIDEYPLYYDAVNEKGLAMAGLNFVDNAYYFDKIDGKDNLASFELIPYILGTCKDIEEVKKLLSNINILNVNFMESLPVSSLHWIIADSTKSIVLESTIKGINYYDNSVGVLTNNPEFPLQLFNLNNYVGLSNFDPKNTFSKDLDLKLYSRGMGGLGLPGDLSSMSRFVRVAYTKMNSLSKDDEASSVSQFFHILGSVDQQRGCCEVRKDEYEITIYTSCMNTDKGIYYYTTYDNSRIHGVDMNKADLETSTLYKYDLIINEEIDIQN